MRRRAAELVARVAVGVAAHRTKRALRHINHALNRAVAALDHRQLGGRLELDAVVRGGHLLDAPPVALPGALLNLEPLALKQARVVHRRAAHARAGRAVAAHRRRAVAAHRSLRRAAQRGRCVRGALHGQPRGCLRAVRNTAGTHDRPASSHPAAHAHACRRASGAPPAQHHHRARRQVHAAAIERVLAAPAKDGPAVHVLD
mmetsp:Transcript_20426/g.63334  ORF Transcript_20426/g.63334 Transcript_20426/m.63334 type:complete len:202 (+) Transcript_20426:908-1513(+)